MDAGAARHGLRDRVGAIRANSCDPSNQAGGRWLSRYDFDDLEPVLDDSARRYEGGGANVITIAGMGASLDLLLEAGIDNVWQHVDGLCQRLATGLVDIGAELRSVHDTENRSAIVSFTLPGPRPRGPRRTIERSEHHRSAPSRCRADVPHAYLTTDDIDATLAAHREPALRREAARHEAGPLSFYVLALRRADAVVPTAAGEA